MFLTTPVPESGALAPLLYFLVECDPSQDAPLLASRLAPRLDQLVAAGQIRSWTFAWKLAAPRGLRLFVRIPDGAAPETVAASLAQAIGTVAPSHAIEWTPPDGEFYRRPFYLENLREIFGGQKGVSLLHHFARRDARLILELYGARLDERLAIGEAEYGVASFLFIYEVLRMRREDLSRDLQIWNGYLGGSFERKQGAAGLLAAFREQARRELARDPRGADSLRAWREGKPWSSGVRPALREIFARHEPRMARVGVLLRAHLDGMPEGRPRSNYFFKGLYHAHLLRSGVVAPRSLFMTVWLEEALARQPAE